MTDVGSGKPSRRQPSMAPAPAREPVLRAGLFGGLAIPDARETRIWVDERGAVMMRRPGIDPFEVAAPGEVTKVAVAAADQIRERRFTPHARRGLVLLMSESRCVAAFNLVDLGSTARFPDDATFRAINGLDAFADGLGLFVEPADPTEVRLARRLRQRDLLPLRDPRHNRRWTSALGLAAWVASFLVLPAAGEDSPLRWPAAALAFALVTVLVWQFHARRRHWLHLVTTPTPADGRQVIRPQPPAELTTKFLARTEVQLGPRDIVIRAAHQERWLPGPEAGGITQVVVGPDHLIFEDHQGRAFVGLQPSVWGPSLEVLLRGLRDLGIGVRESPMHDSRLIDYMAAELDVTAPYVITDDYENASDGSVVVPCLPYLALFLLGLGCVILAAVDFPLGLVTLLPWLALQALAIRATWTLSHWSRSQGRPADPSAARNTGGER
ncbi:hypothetical protein IEQ44_06140 [Nocardioides sp. Y6]|uniref:DUF2207 domain-containing protein n=1 Tax=Nocardioides malaquae TaxID=2773426 RepID=A0ABR9RRQ8_9ACTN|nr:hypothetical protein [Nocardioides malaquae]MBE7324226.1 hypothetical protein [Nocardioides malaquae]